MLNMGVDDIGAFKVEVNKYQEPSGTSTRSMRHWRQLVLVEDKNPLFLKKYDFGNKEENLKRYGSETAPVYDVGKLEGREMLIMHGSKDKVIGVDSAKELQRRLGGCVRLEVFEEWGHFTFGLPMNADKIWKTLDEYFGKE